MLCWRCVVGGVMVAVSDVQSVTSLPCPSSSDTSILLMVCSGSSVSRRDDADGCAWRRKGHGHNRHIGVGQARRSVDARPLPERILDAKRVKNIASSSAVSTPNGSSPPLSLSGELGTSAHSQHARSSIANGGPNALMSTCESTTSRPTPPKAPSVACVVAPQEKLAQSTR